MQAGEPTTTPCGCVQQPARYFAVYLGLVAGATTAWLRPPPSDQVAKRYDDRANASRDGAATEFVEPTTAVTENGAVPRTPFTSRSAGTMSPRLVRNRRTTVFGSSRTLAVDDSPPESVAVSCSSSQHG